jgi:hypothetical protein
MLARHTRTGTPSALFAGPAQCGAVHRADRRDGSRLARPNDRQRMHGLNQLPDMAAARPERLPPPRQVLPPRTPPLRHPTPESGSHRGGEPSEGRGEAWPLVLLCHALRAVPVGGRHIRRRGTDHVRTKRLTWTVPCSELARPRRVMPGQRRTIDTPRTLCRSSVIVCHHSTRRGLGGRDRGKDQTATVPEGTRLTRVELP